MPFSAAFNHVHCSLILNLFMRCAGASLSERSERSRGSICAAMCSPLRRRESFNMSIRRERAVESAAENGKRCSVRTLPYFGARNAFPIPSNRNWCSRSHSQRFDTSRRWEKSSKHARKKFTNLCFRHISARWIAFSPSLLWIYVGAKYKFKQKSNFFRIHALFELCEASLQCDGIEIHTWTLLFAFFSRGKLLQFFCKMVPSFVVLASARALSAHTRASVRFAVLRLPKGMNWKAISRRARMPCVRNLI